MAINQNHVHRTVDAANEFTDVISIRGPLDQPAYLLVISDNNSSFSGTITVQVRVPDGTDWVDLTTYTASFAQNITMNSNCDIRIGCKTGEFTSGSIDVHLIYGP